MMISDEGRAQHAQVQTALMTSLMTSLIMIFGDDFW